MSMCSLFVFHGCLECAMLVTIFVLRMPTICLSRHVVVAIRDLVNCTIISLPCTLCGIVGLVVPGIP
jgi:hypothetical protein